MTNSRRPRSRTITELEMTRQLLARLGDDPQSVKTLTETIARLTERAG